MLRLSGVILPASGGMINQRMRVRRLRVLTQLVVLHRLLAPKLWLANPHTLVSCFAR